MRKLTICEHITLDGIIQHTPDENNFPHNDWTAPYRSLVGRDLLIVAQGENYDLLLGRRTYDIWSGVWPQAPSGPFSDQINRGNKYVLTHSPETLAWGPFEAVGPDLIEGVRRLKAQQGQNILLWGSSTLTSPLLAAGLVDEVLLIVYPVLLGAGKRFFAEGTPPRSFELLRTETTPTGVLLNRYRFVGPLKLG